MDSLTKFRYVDDFCSIRLSQAIGNRSLRRGTNQETRVERLVKAVAREAYLLERAAVASAGRAYPGDKVRRGILSNHIMPF